MLSTALLILCSITVRSKINDVPLAPPPVGAEGRRETDAQQEERGTGSCTDGASDNGTDEGATTDRTPYVMHCTHNACILCWYRRKFVMCT